MRKRLALFVILCFVVMTTMMQQGVGFAINNPDVPYCELMSNPVSDRGVLDQTHHCLFTLQESAIVRMASKNGHFSKCELQPGTSVVVDKETHDWLKVRACDNYFPRGFHLNVKGLLDCFDEKEVASTEIQKQLVEKEVVVPIPAPVPAPVQVVQERPRRAPSPPMVEVSITRNGQVVEEVKAGKEVVVHWEGHNTDECVALAGPGFSTGRMISGSQKIVLNKKGYWNFDVQCHGPGGYVVGEAGIAVKKNVWGWVLGGIAVVGLAVGLSGHGGGSSSGGRVGPPIP